jgi:hypothetical protein
MLPIFQRLVVPVLLVLGLLNPADEGTMIFRKMGSCQLIWCNTSDDGIVECRCVLSYLAEGTCSKVREVMHMAEQDDTSFIVAQLN